MHEYDAFLNGLQSYIESRDDLRLVFIVGSRARTDMAADEWSDLDVLLVTTEPAKYLEDAEWLAELGKAHLTFLEPTAVGGFVERRALFDGGLDVDFAVIPYDKIKEGWPPEALGVFRRGVKVLLDREGLAAQFPQPTEEADAWTPPSEREYAQLVNDFLYHAVWVAKKLGRGEVWTAKSCCDGMMKYQLLRMTEWHAKLTRGADTWHGGRFLEQWADPRVVARLGTAFAVYEREDVWRALKRTVEVFREVAVETAEKIGAAYPLQSDAYVVELIRTYHER